MGGGKVELPECRAGVEGSGLRFGSVQYYQACTVRDGTVTVRYDTSG